MFLEVMKKMPIGMYEKIRGCYVGPKLNESQLTKVINLCREEYPEYFDRLNMYCQFELGAGHTDELAPAALMGVSIAAGYAMAMGRKVYDDYYGSKQKELAPPPNYEIRDERGSIPDFIKDKFNEATRKALPRLEADTPPPSSIEVIQRVYDNIVPTLWRKSPLPVSEMIGRVDKQKVQEIAPPLIVAGGVIVGAAIADNTYDKVIDAARDWLKKK